MRSSKAMKAATGACMPRLMRGKCRASTARPAASVSLLERIRDVVLRLIMLTAVSKASVQRSGSKASSARAGGRGREAAAAVTCRRDDSIRNEAVEDCIEFLKRSSAEGDAAKLSSVTAESASVEVDIAKLPSVNVHPAKKPWSAGAETVAVHGESIRRSNQARAGAEAASVKASVLASVEVRRREASPAV